MPMRTKIITGKSHDFLPRTRKKKKRAQRKAVKIKKKVTNSGER